MYNALVNSGLFINFVKSSLTDSVETPYLIRYVLHIVLQHVLSTSGQMVRAGSANFDEYGILLQSVHFNTEELCTFIKPRRYFRQLK